MELLCRALLLLWRVLATVENGAAMCSATSGERLESLTLACMNIAGLWYDAKHST